MAKLAGLPPDTQLKAYEEVKWDPTVMIEAIDPTHTLHQVGLVADLAIYIALLWYLSLFCGHD
jgi:hypothetical protein